MSDAQNTMPENTPAAVDPAGQVDAGNANTESQEGAAPKWDGEFDPQRAQKLIENLRSDLSKLKAEKSELSSKLGEKEDAEKTELQRIMERAEQAEKRAHEASLRAITLEYDIPEDLADFLSGDDEDAIRSKAQKLADFAKSRSAAEMPSKPKTKLVPGAGESPAPDQLTRDDLKKMSPESILQAEAEGRLQAISSES